MLKEKKLKNGKIMLEGTTPKGKSLYAKVHEPQSKIGGQPVDPFYSITLLMDKDDPAAQNFIQQLDNFMEQAELLANEFVSKAKGRQRQKPQLQNANYGEYFDDEGNETNYYFIKAKAKASGTTQAGKKWNFKPSVFDVDVAFEGIGGVDERTVKNYMIPLHSKNPLFCKTRGRICPLFFVYFLFCA